jgi:hypothetical protein
MIMSKSKHVATWFEIPVRDLARATAFYNEVMGVELDVVEYGPTKMAIFPLDEGDEQERDRVHGALVQGDGYVPSEDGTRLYLNGGEDLAAPLARVEAAGGQIVQPKTSIGSHGFVATFRDTEGNHMALHSMQ